MAGDQGMVMVVMALACCCMLSVGGLGGFYFFYQPFRDWMDKTLGIKAADPPPADPDVDPPVVDPLPPAIDVSERFCPSPLEWRLDNPLKCWNPATSAYVDKPKYIKPTVQPTTKPTTKPTAKPTAKDEWLCAKGFSRVTGTSPAGKECKNASTGAFSSPMHSVTGWICLGGTHTGNRVAGKECKVGGKVTGTGRWGCPHDQVFNPSLNKCCKGWNALGNSSRGCTAPVQVA